MENIYPFLKSFSFLNGRDPTGLASSPEPSPATRWTGDLFPNPSPPLPRLRSSSTANPPLPHARVQAPPRFPLTTLPVRLPATAAVALAACASVREPSRPLCRSAARCVAAMPRQEARRQAVRSLLPLPRMRHMLPLLGMRRLALRAA
jgi:hypothetical protein